MNLRDQMGSDLEKVFFSENDFAEVATYRPVSGSSYEVTGIFDEKYVEIDPNTQTAVSSNSPKFKLQESKIIGGVKEKDEITIRGVAYRIKDRHSDGNGVIDLILNYK